MTEATYHADTVRVPKATHWRLCAIVRLWDAWLLSDRQDDKLLEAAANLTTRFTGSEAGARMEVLEP